MTPRPWRDFPAAVASLMMAMAAAAAQAEEPDIKGRWIGRTASCDQLVITVANQAPNGVIEGDIFCARTGVRMPFGEKLIQGRQLAGRFDGTSLSLVMDEGYIRAELEGGRLVSRQFRGPSAPPTQIIFARQ